MKVVYPVIASDYALYPGEKDYVRPVKVFLSEKAAEEWVDKNFNRYDDLVVGDPIDFEEL